MSAIDCFQNIIGLSRTECDCFPDVDSTTSQSGLYIDEFVPLTRLSSLLNCAIGDDLWEMLDRLRDRAITAFMADANAMMLQYYKQRRQPFIGAIGRAKRKNVVSGMTIGRRYGLRMYCANIVGGECTVSKIGGIFDSTGTLTIDIYNNLNDLIDTVVIDIEAGKHKLTDVDITLPMHSKYIENLEYFFVYTYSGINPYDNDIKCDCGSFKPYYNTNYPKFGMRSEVAYEWNKYAMVGGYSGGDDFMNATTTAPNRLYGLTLDVSFKCNTSEVLCKDYLDFDTNPLANAMAYAVLYKSCELAHHQFLNSTNINRELLTNTDQDTETMKMYATKYSEILVYIVQNINHKVNDCFDCRSFIDIAKSGILA